MMSGPGRVDNTGDENDADPMNEAGLTDKMLMAFVDGEVDEPTAASIAAAVAADPSIAARVEEFRESGRVAREVFSDILSEPVPDRLLTAVLMAPETNIVRIRRRWFASREMLPLAATLLLAAGIGGGFWLGQQTAGTDGPLPESSEIASLLATQPSGPASAVSLHGRETALTVLGSYRIADGVCRMFRLDDPKEAVRAVACDRGAGFTTEFAIADNAAGSGFSPASERATEMADAYLDTIEASAPLEPADEARLLGAKP